MELLLGWKPEGSVLRNFIKSIHHVIRRKQTIFPHLVNEIFGVPRRSLNLGGGPWFAALGWKNLEGVSSSLNPHPFRFSPDCVFPFADESFDLVYSSHMLEHLDPASISRVLSEAFRVTRPGGRFILKVPDYDKLLAEWRAGETNFVSSKLWDFQSVKWTWPEKGVADSPGYRTAYIICGYWNKAYGEHFDRSRQREAGGYNGPVPMPEAELVSLLNTGDPSHISQVLRTCALSIEPELAFNHQTAWAREELAALIAGAGFKVEIQSDDKSVIRRAASIPGIRKMEEVSSYFLAIR
jgi:SAM-dependent methyltransferase